MLKCFTIVIIGFIIIAYKTYQADYKISNNVCTALVYINVVFGDKDDKWRIILPCHTKV